MKLFLFPIFFFTLSIPLLAQSKQELKEELVRLKEQVYRLTTENVDLDARNHDLQQENHECATSNRLLQEKITQQEANAFRITELMRENNALRAQLELLGDKKARRVPPVQKPQTRHQSSGKIREARPKQ